MEQMIPEHTPGSPAVPGPQTGDAASGKPKHDPTFTDKVIAATGPNANRRLAEVMPSLVRHLHAFAREVNLTVGEWSAAVEFVSPRQLLVMASCAVLSSPHTPPTYTFPRTKKLT
jgi:catechol 1,2-dioxygenase